jgi:hypothetical protein
MPLTMVGLNVDDGFILGAGFKFTKQGDLEIPYASMQQLVAGHSFSAKHTGSDTTANGYMLWALQI